MNHHTLHYSLFVLCVSFALPFFFIRGGGYWSSFLLPSFYILRFSSFFLDLRHVLLAFFMSSRHFRVPWQANLGVLLFSPDGFLMCSQPSTPLAHSSLPCSSSRMAFQLISRGSLAAAFPNLSLFMSFLSRVALPAHSFCLAGSVGLMASACLFTT